VVSLVMFFMLGGGHPALAAFTLALFLLAGAASGWVNRSSLREEAQRRSHGQCIFCGYDLRGSPEDRCSECGRPAGRLPTGREVAGEPDDGPQSGKPS
jgi:hypothetical protein